MNNYELPDQTEFRGDAEEAQQIADNEAQFDVLLQEQQQDERDEVAAVDKASAESKDPRQDNDGDGKPDVEFNLGDIGAELSSALGGGLQDAASSVATLPERIGDTFNGQMEAAGDNYRPEWDPFTDHEDPIETHTWWGGAIRGLVQFGGLALGTVAAAKGIAAVGGATLIGKGAAWLGAGVSGGLKANMLRGAAVGAVGDVISRDSQKHNAMGAIAERYPALNNPLATQDSDHPAMKTFKNVVEGMGIGGVFDLGLEAIGYGFKSLKNGKSVAEVVDARNTSVKEQTIERGKSELKKSDGTQPMAHANKPILDRHQGNPTSNGKAVDVEQQAVRIRKEAGAEDGSTDSLVSARQLEVMKDKADDLGDATHEAVRDELFAKPEIKGPVLEAKAAQKAGTKTLKQMEPEIMEVAHEMTFGRLGSDITPQELFKRFEERSNTDGLSGQRYWNGQDVYAAGLVNYELMKEIRDVSKAGLELIDNVDVTAVGGPLDTLQEKLIYSMVNVNKANKLASDDFRARQKANPRKAKQELLDDKAQTVEMVNTITQLLKDDPNDKALKGILEIFSGSGEIVNMGDYSAAMRAWMNGADKSTGALAKELGGMFTHSVLSGPKTPVRAIGGTGSMAFLRPMSQALGSAMRGDFIGAQANLAGANAMIRAVPDAFKLFKTRLGAQWSGEVANTKTRFSDYVRQEDEKWAMYQDWIETSPDATLGDKAAAGIASVVRGMNSNKFLTLNTKIMDSGDKAFNVLMARGRAAEKYTREAIQSGKGVNPESLAKAESDFLASITDADGFIDMDKVKLLDPELYGAAKEVTLTTELTGFAKSIQSAMESNPWTKPFFLFAKTGVNGLAIAGKHTPGVNLLLKKQRAIFTTSPDDLRPVMKYGINSVEELQNAKSLALGRQAIGTGVIFMAAQMHMNGNLRGSGPQDRQLRKVWEDNKYKRNTAKIGDVWVNFEAFEPFNQILTLVADIGDHSQLMGEDFTKDKFKQLSMVVAEGVTSKSYLSSLQDFVDFISGDPKAAGRIAGGLVNNTVPLSSLRNELGKLFSPHIRELNSDFATAVRNRNQLTENGADQLPIKYDILNGQSIKDQDFPTRMFNMFSPVQFNLDGGPGRDLLFRSNYDLRTSVNSYNGYSFAENAEIRSEFQRLIGEQNLESKLDKMAEDPTMMNSIKQMELGDQSKEPSDYPHYDRIKVMFDTAKKKAWAELKKREDVKVMIKKTMDTKAEAATTRNNINSQNEQLRSILNIPN
jgi:hypothetical protein